ncbi:hypothetical protein CA13_12330 [Planctomycetes bacterium CA13]|uniref:Uncharacterized protein n=1 Tax=Novipirellula herctigrandis TaxID=2527986 RepID=A0A5C5YYR9_9BACT|nr:hypothetical protein CA13_12330 [Planctomycetes bacterium CA13]
MDWFDREIWKLEGTSEYDRPVSPEDLLSESPDAIWPGLMQCDMLPILGDSAGNWLCLRVGQDNAANQIVQWYHGGGDWMPWGNRLADAIVFETFVDKLPGKHRRLAIPAEDAKEGFRPHEDPLVRWAFEHQAEPVRRLLDEAPNDESLAKTLLSHQVAEIAVRCELIHAAMDQPWAEKIDKKIASEMGFAWNQIVEWMFDGKRMPKQAREKIQKQLKLPDIFFKKQDWETIMAHSQMCRELAPELTWPWDLVGYGHERQGNEHDAITYYQQGAMRSTFTDQSVRMHTHWTQMNAAKFSVARMEKLDSDFIKRSPYLSLLRCGESNHSHQGVFDYWVNQAKQAERSNEAAKSIECLMQAGWDLGIDSIDQYGPLIDEIVEATKFANQTARSTLAKTHRNCLADRYGI